MSTSSPVTVLITSGPVMNMWEVVDHDHVVGQGGGVGRAAGGGADDRVNLRDDVVSVDVVAEDVRETWPGKRRTSWTSGAEARRREGAITTTISPFCSPRNRRASSPRLPRATSSWSLVSSRQTAAGGRERARRARAGSREGAAATRTRRRSRSICRTRSSSPGRRGRKPSNRHRSGGSAEATRAVVIAEGPGSTSTSRSRSMHSRISR